MAELEEVRPQVAAGLKDDTSHSLSLKALCILFCHKLQMAELEEVQPQVAAGLEDDPDLVRLWRKMGGPRHRHHNLHAIDRRVCACVCVCLCVCVRERDR